MENDINKQMLEPLVKSIESKMEKEVNDFIQKDESILDSPFAGPLILDVLFRYMKSMKKMMLENDLYILTDEEKIYIVETAFINAKEKLIEY